MRLRRRVFLESPSISAAVRTALEIAAASPASTKFRAEVAAASVHPDLLSTLPAEGDITSLFNDVPVL